MQIGELVRLEEVAEAVAHHDLRDLGQAAERARRRLGHATQCDTTCRCFCVRRPRSRGHEELLDVQVREADARQVAEPLDAEVARPPLGEELAVERVAAARAGRRCRRRAARGAAKRRGSVIARSCEMSSVNAQKLSDSSLTPCSFAQASVSAMRNSVSAVRRVGPAPHRRERPAAAGRRWARDAGSRRSPRPRSPRPRTRVPGTYSSSMDIVKPRSGWLPAPQLRDRVQPRAQRRVGVLGDDDTQRVARLRRAASPTGAPCGSAGPRARTRPVAAPPPRRARIGRSPMLR